MNNKSNSRLVISTTVGIIAIGTAIYLSFFESLKNSSQWIMSIFLFIFGIACLTELWSGKISLENNYIKSTRNFAVFVFLCAFIFNRINPPAEESSLKLQIRDWRGKTVLSNEKQAIKVSSGKFSKTYDIDSDGDVLLTFIRNSDSVKIELLSENWQLNTSTRSTTFKIPKDEILGLQVIPSENRCCLKGRIVFADNKLHDLSDVIIQCGNTNTKTLADGSYQLKLPMEIQLQDGLNVSAKVGGYYIGQVTCNSVSPCDIILKKSSN